MRESAPHSVWVCTLCPVVALTTTIIHHVFTILYTSSSLILFLFESHDYSFHHIAIV